MEYQYNSVPPQYSQPDSRHPAPESFNSTAFTMPEIERLRSRGQSGAQSDGYTSDSSRCNQARQPINDAVASVLNTSDATVAAGITPELVNHLTTQITANVLHQLKAGNIPIIPNSTTIPAMHCDTQSSAADSPPLGRSVVYTPPSPYRASEEAAQTQISPSGEAKTGQYVYGSGTPPLGGRSLSPTASSFHSEDNDVKEAQTIRPTGFKRSSTSGSATVMEKVWGKMFNDQGQATVRLGQFLRGIAVHLVEDYEPRHSLVITPTKLQQYYRDTKVEADIYPWHHIFDNRTSCISRMFREIEAEHHLVQDRLDERPDTPGLTPQGFETWATLLLRAHPDQEFERLAKTAMSMPISNPDDRKERFPKELPRRLFPKDSDPAVVTSLQKAIVAHCNVKLPTRQNSTTMSDSQPSSPKASFSTTADKQEPLITPVSSHTSQATTTSSVSFATVTPETSVETEDDETPTPKPIERERKPYVAAPGGGKTYASESVTASESKIPPSHSKPARTLSMSSGIRQSRPIPIVTHQTTKAEVPIEVAGSRRQRPNNAYPKDQATPKSARNRSPSSGREGLPGRRSEPDTSFSSHQPSSSYENREDQRRYRDYETQRDRHPGDKYDAARMAAYDPREREREREREYRSRGMSINTGYDTVKTPHSAGADEEYYRSAGGYSVPRDSHQSYSGTSHYPPSAFRESR